MPVARRPIYFVMAKRWLTLDWSSNLSCHIHTRTNHWVRSKFCVSPKERETEIGTHCFANIPGLSSELQSILSLCHGHRSRLFLLPSLPWRHILKPAPAPPPKKPQNQAVRQKLKRERDPAGTQTDRDGQENKRWDGQDNNKHIPTWYKRPSGEKMVMWRSYPAPDPLLMVSKPSMLLSLLYSSSSASASRVVRVLFSQLLSSKTVSRNPNS